MTPWGGVEDALRGIAYAVQCGLRALAWGTKTDELRGFANGVCFGMRALSGRPVRRRAQANRRWRANKRRRLAAAEAAS